MAHIRTATIDEIAKYRNTPSFQSPVNRRKLLEITGGIGLAALISACSGTEVSPTSPSPNPTPTPAPNPPTPTPTTAYLQGQVPLEGLLYKSKGSGQVVIPGKKPIAYENGIMTFDESHELLPGVYTDVEIIPSDSRGVRRKTPVEIDKDGLFWVDIGYKKVPLDYIDDSNLALKWAATRHDYATIAHGLRRVDSNVKSLKKFLYDNSRWRIGREIEQSDFVKVQEGVPASQKIVNQDIIDQVTSVVNNDYLAYSNSEIQNEGLIRESMSSLRPRYDEPGWFVYTIGEHNIGAIATGNNGGVLSNGGDITNAHYMINPMKSWKTRHAISYDTFEQLFGAKDGSYRPIDDLGFPSQEVHLLAKIQFNRKLLNRTMGNIIDYQN